MDVIETGNAKGMKGSVVAMNEDDGTLHDKCCLMDVSARDVDGQTGAMILLQPEGERALMDALYRKKLKKKKKNQFTKKEREDIHLHSTGYWQQRQFFKFSVENVDLAHTNIGGALAAHADLPTEPKFRMLRMIQSDIEGDFTLQQLRSWMLKTASDARPECLRKINAFQTKKVKVIFKDMDQNGDGKVDDDEFIDWWSTHVEPMERSSPTAEAEVSVTVVGDSNQANALATLQVIQQEDAQKR